MKPINQPKSLVEVAAERIRVAIIAGELELGAKLSEQRLADALQVSRSPIHDALAVLQSEWLVDISPKRGSFVFTPDLRMIDELCEHRAVLECAAIHMGISRNNKVLATQLKQAIEKMQTRIDSGDAPGYTEADMQFHSAIVDSCDNHSIIKSYHQAVSPLKALRNHLFTKMLVRPEESMIEHVAILNACTNRDVGAAVAQLEQHVGHLARAFRSALATSELVEPKATFSTLRKTFADPSGKQDLTK